MRITLWSRLAALLITTLFALGMLYLIVGGGFTVTAIAEEQPTTGEMTTYVGRSEPQPYSPAIMPLIVALIIIGGLLNERLLALTWIGLALMTLMGFMLMFGPGIFCWGLVLALTVPLSLIHWQRSGSAVWLILGALGAFLLILGGLEFGGAIGGISLAAGSISALLLAWLYVQSRQQQAAML